MNMSLPKYRIGTRGSRLALVQAEETCARLAATHGLEADRFEIVTISTTGDRVRDRPLSDIGGKGLFTKEIEEALLAGTIDIAVHSLKDMANLMPEGLVLAACLPREDPRDALLSPTASRIQDLATGARIGTSSVRRAAQMLHRRPDLVILPFRGTVETRLKKLDSGDVEATFLACAGLRRLGLEERITSPLPITELLPAVAQGAIALQVRTDTPDIFQTAQALDDAPTAAAIACERAFLSRLDGSCRTPIAGHAYLDGADLVFAGEALTPDGTHCFQVTRRVAAADGARAGDDAAQEILKTGGAILRG